MNAVLYNSNSHKKINGTLFYCFEYFLFLKNQTPDLKYILLNTSEKDVEMFKGIFQEKYHFDESVLNDIINLTKITDYIKLDVQNLLVLDIHSYEKVKDFTGKAKSVRIYSNESHKHLNKKPHHKFYGFYDYQDFNYKTRLKFLIPAHKTFKKKGNKTFVTSLNIDYSIVVNDLGLNKDEIFVKNLNSHNSNLFESVDKMIYYHSGNTDTNNRAVVEAFIHKIPLKVYLNGYEHDSIKERHQELLKSGLGDFRLTKDDILISDFLGDCNGFTS